MERRVILSALATNPVKHAATLVFCIVNKRGCMFYEPPNPSFPLKFRSRYANIKPSITEEIQSIRGVQLCANIAKTTNILNLARKTGGNSSGLKAET
jgi:hypothetical protein